MTSVEARTRSSESTPAGRPALALRLRTAAPLVVGALLVLVLIKPVGSLPTKGWVPVLVGLSYVASGLLSNRRGLLLAPGIILAAWGIAPMSTNYGYDFGGMFYLTLGSGLLIAAVLAQRGWYRITPMSLAIPVLFLGGVMALAPHLGRYLTSFLAVLLVGWAIWELVSRSDAAGTWTSTDELAATTHRA